MLTTIIGIDPRFEFSSTQQAVWCRDGPFPMHPFRFNGVEPWACARQRTGDHAHALSTLLDLLMVLAEPAPHGVAAVPRGVIPDQEQGREASRCELGGAPRQKLYRDGTHGTPRDTAPPHLVRLLRPWAHQQAITGQRLGISVLPRWRQLLELRGGLRVCPTVLVGLGQPAPPDFVAKPERPPRLGVGPLDHLVASFFFRVYAGSGLVLQCLARFQATLNRRRATRMASSLTSRGVSPWAKLTSAASWRVHRLVGVPNVRGLWCNRARRASQVPASKMVAMVWGRDDCGCSATRPRWWNACSALRTVYSVQRRSWAIVGVTWPSALASRIWQRRTVQADEDRRPVSRVARSSAISGRTYKGVCMAKSIPHAQRPLLELH